MENFFQKFKNGIYVGLGILFTLSIGVFAYQYVNYEDIEDVEVGQTLTKDTFNQLLANVRNLKDEINTMSGVLATKGIKGSDIDGYNGIIRIPNSGLSSSIYSDSIVLTKGLYLFYFYSVNDISTSLGRYSYSVIKALSNDDDVSTIVEGQTFVGELGYASPMVVRIISDSATIRVVFSVISGYQMKKEYLFSSDTSISSAVRYVKISD